MSTTPICDSQKYTVVKKDDGTLECVIPLHVGMKLETELAAAREALRKIAKQMTPAELDDDCRYEGADFEVAYATMIMHARAALAAKERE